MLWCSMCHVCSTFALPDCGDDSVTAIQHYFSTHLTALSLGVLPIQPPSSSGARVALVSPLPCWYSYAQFRMLCCLLPCFQRSHIRWCNVPFDEQYWHVIELCLDGMRRR
jgi:hypothetical protein